jgi:PAS domain S-box-containing protein
VQSSDDAIISKTLEGVILTWNHGAERMFGYTAKEVVGHSIYILLPPDRINEEPLILDAIKRGESIDHLETVRVGKDRRAIDTLLTISPIKDQDGKITGASTIAHDITERKRAEKELQELLHSEQEARADAQAANRVKDEFLAVVSHELRTPLNSIMGWAQLMRRGQLDADNTKRAVNSIVHNAEAQAKIIDDLLDTARIMSGKLRLNRKLVNINEVINAAVEAFRADAEKKSIDLFLGLDSKGISIEGDGRRLEQAIGNLLSNAIKFTPEAGRIEVQLSQLEDDARIVVKDNGKGISPRFLPYVFDRFKQADASEKRIEGGLGLGLSIARQLVQRHGGTIKAESDGLGRGSTFTIRLPFVHAWDSGELRIPSAAEPADEPIHGVKISLNFLAGLRILVVEDQPDTRDLVTFALSKYGAEITTCGSAEEAFNLVRKWKPNVVVSDIGLPKEDGYELMKKVRALKAAEGGRVPALALTGYASSADEAKALAAGYQAHMAKPVELEELVRTIAALSGRLGT